MFGIDDAIGGALVSAAGGLIGDAMSASSASNLNKANRQFQFDMSNTEMQRRVTDLKAAGLNPMLAVSQGGGGMGATYMTPQTQVPGAAFGNLGQQMSSAVQLMAQKAQIRATNAQAAMTEAQTPGSDVFPPVKSDGTIDWNAYASMPGHHMLGNLNAAQMAQNINVADSTIRSINQQIDQSKSQVDLNDASKAMLAQNLDIAKATMKWTIQQAMAQANLTEANVSAADAEAKVMSSPLGPVLKFLQNVPGVGSVLSGIAQVFLSRGTTTETSHVGPGGVYKGGSVTTTR